MGMRCAGDPWQMLSIAMQHPAPNYAGHLPSRELVARIQKLVELVGMVRASRDLGIGREALARLAGGLRVRAGTISLAEQAIAASAPSPAPAGASSSRTSSPAPTTTHSRASSSSRKTSARSER